MPSPALSSHFLSLNLTHTHPSQAAHTLRFLWRRCFPLLQGGLSPPRAVHTPGVRTRGEFRTLEGSGWEESLPHTYPLCLSGRHACDSLPKHPLRFLTLHTHLVTSLSLTLPHLFRRWEVTLPPRCLGELTHTYHLGASPLTPPHTLSAGRRNTFPHGRNLRLTRWADSCIVTDWVRPSPPVAHSGQTVSLIPHCIYTAFSGG